MNFGVRVPFYDGARKKHWEERLPAIELEKQKLEKVARCSY